MTSAYSRLDRPPLHELALRRALLVPGSLWTELRIVRSTGSTNSDLVALARSGVPAGAVLVAEEQTAGRGRYDRRWQAPAQSALTFSVLLRPPRVASLGWLPLLVGVALAQAVARLAELDVALKWPNDLLVRASGAGSTVGDEDAYRKCAGILAEVVAPPAGASATGARPVSVPAVVVGVGLNVSQDAGELPPSDATSLTLAGAATADRDPLLKAILRTIEIWYRRFEAADYTSISTAYRQLCQTVGRQVRVSLPGGGVLAGRAIDVDDDGHLVVESTDGLRRLAAGDVAHVR